MKIALQNSHKINKRMIVADIISAAIMLLLLYTALSKLWDYQLFRSALAASPLLKPVSGVIAWLLPVTELLVAVLLFIPAFRLKGLRAALILITVFTLYLIYMVSFTPDLPCNCGGVLKWLTWKAHIFFNLFFILLSVMGIFLHKKRKNRKSSPPP